jgi:hypothetical protein
VQGGAAQRVSSMKNASTEKISGVVFNVIAHRAPFTVHPSPFTLTFFFTLPQIFFPFFVCCKKKSLNLQLESRNSQYNIQNLILPFTMRNIGKNNTSLLLFDAFTQGVENFLLCGGGGKQL